MAEPELIQAVQTIAATLKETEKGPIAQIYRLIKVLGEERVSAILAETLQIEADGGMLTDDGSHRRTPGGAFFKLVKTRITSRERGTIFGSRPAAAAKPQPNPITWEESQQLSTEAFQSPKGEVHIVKVTLIGRPGRIIAKENVVITSMQNSKPPTLPKGLPVPPGDPTVYVVYIALKQWQKVRDSLTQHPDDKLIIEGYPIFDRRIGQSGALTVYTQSATTTLLQQALREKKIQQ